MVKLLLGVWILLTASVALAQQPPVNVVATYSILGDIVKNIAGDKVQLTVLVGPDGDAHTFEPTPKESIALSQAQVVLENGMHFEHFLDDLYQASGSQARRVVVTEGIKSRVFEGHGEEQEEDPHAWQDIANVIVMVKHIQEALQEVDPVNKSVYEANAADYLNQLNQLNAWVKDQVALLEPRNRKLVTSHDALGYFADAYGFEIIGTVIPSATTEAEDPSAKQVAELLDVIKTAGVKAIFTENIQNAKLATAVANDAKVKVAPGLYTDALGSSGSDGETYIKMIQYNVRTIVEALK